PAAYALLSSAINACPPNGRNHSGTRGSSTSIHVPASSRAVGVSVHRNVPTYALAPGRPTAAGSLAAASDQLRTASRTTSAYSGGTDTTPPSGVPTPTTSRIAPSHPGLRRCVDPTTVKAPWGGHSPRYA